MTKHFGVFFGSQCSSPKLAYYDMFEFVTKLCSYVQDAVGVFLDVVINCDFLLVVNSNIDGISHGIPIAAAT